MRNYPFEKNFPSISYIANNWPRTKNVLKKFILSTHKLPDLYNLCLNCLNDLNVHKIDKMKYSKELSYQRLPNSRICN